MLKSAILHPELLRALASAGHGSKVLVADSNFPFNTGKNADAQVIYLNLCPGKLSCIEVMKALVDEIPIEGLEVMASESGEPAIYTEMRNVVPGREMIKRGKSLFFDHARAHDTFLVIATGDENPYASVLLTIGVVPPHSA